MHSRPAPDAHLLPLLERKRLFDNAWIVSVVAGLGAVAALWFSSLLEIQLERAAWWVFGYTLTHLCVATLTDRLSNPALLGLVIRVKSFVSVVFLGVLWHLVGGLDNPTFLIMFALPVFISGIMMLGIHAHFTAALSVLVVFVVGMAESPELAWYFDRFEFWIPSVHAFFPVSTGPSEFQRVGLGPIYEFRLLAVFAAMQFIIAFVASPLTVLLHHINARVETSGKLLTEVQGLFHAVLSASPEPTLIVYADSGQVVQASDSFFERMLLRPSQLVGKGLFEVVRFADPDRVRSALTAPSGEIRFCLYEIDAQTRIANISFYRTDHAGTAFMYLGWQELTDLYYLQAAFDAIEDPLLVISAAGRVHYGNDRAKALFGPLPFGMDTESLPSLQRLTASSSTDASGDPLVHRHEIDGCPYQVQKLLAPLPGESETCTILWLHSVAREEALFEQAVRDPLTGIYNRRYFDDALMHQIERSHRGHKVALAYFDLDYFKQINDRFGHAAGDAALLAFVQAVKAQLRETDIFARRGGDEFAVIFVECETDVAAAAIERLRAMLRAQGCTHEGHRFDVGFSAGLAACHRGDGVVELLERADKAVYAAKESGKGRLVIEP
jgi:diguanylate cyclase (GGDEF)-like protein